MPQSNRHPPIPQVAGWGIQAAAAPRPHDDAHPLWAGPSGDGPLGGVTQSMLVRFLSCRERFRLRYVLGLEPHDKWSKTLGYGNMWHAAEEALAKEPSVQEYLADPSMVNRAIEQHTVNECIKYPLQRDEIQKWFRVARVQFPEYVRYWSEHPDVVGRTPLLQEQVFDVPYYLPSGRRVRLRGKFDSVDLIDGGVWLQENKTRGDIDKLQVERQLKFDLQTMMYLTALQWLPRDKNCREAVERVLPRPWDGVRVAGVRYNVVRRPLSGGKGNISPHKERATKNTFKPAETDDEFYERLRADYLAAEPDYWFFRVRAEVTAKDIKVFRDTCLDPLLEQLCQWYDQVTGAYPEHQDDRPYVPLNYRTPFGVWSALEEGGATEYDAYLDNGSEAGLRRVFELFEELK